MKSVLVDVQLELTPAEERAVEAATEAFISLVASAWRIGEGSRGNLAAIRPHVADYITHAMLPGRADALPADGRRLQ